MPGTIVAEETLNVGRELVVEGASPSTQFATVFEDDGDTGYFYGLDTKKAGNPIVDALHIYNVADVINKVGFGLVAYNGIKAIAEVERSMGLRRDEAAPF